MTGGIFLLTLVFIVLYLKLSPGNLIIKPTNDFDEPKYNFKKIITSGIILVLGFVAMVINPFTLRKTDSANVA